MLWGSKEYVKILENYKVETKLEKLAVQVLLTEYDKVVDIPGLMDLEGDEFLDLAKVIRDIREELGLEGL